jgi:integrase
MWGWKGGARKRAPMFENYVNVFLAWSKVNHRPRTTELHRQNLLVLSRYFSRRRLNEITAGMIEEFKLKRLAEPRRGNGWKSNQPIAPSTVNRELTTLRLVINHAIRSGEYGELRNPAAAVIRFREFGSMRVLTREEESRYLAAIRSPNLRDAAALVLETGMRPPEEVLGLRAKDVDLERMLVRVANHERNDRVVVMGKTPGANRAIPLSSRAAAILRRRLVSCTACATFIFPGAGRTGHVAYLRKQHARAVRRAGISPAFRMYDLRHTFATRAAQAGVPIPVLAAILGHSDVRMTMRYIHPQEDAMRAAIAKLEAAG